MKVGDLVSLIPLYEGEKAVGIVTGVDPEELGDDEEVEVLWISGFTDRSYHSTHNLELISAGS